MNYIALIPSYEPDDKLIHLVKELKEQKFICIVVNDGSNESYNVVFEKCKCYAKVIAYVANKGKGHALKTGFKYIKDHYQECIVVTVDSDGQHRVEDALKLCDYVSKHHDTLALGKRIRNNQTPLRSKVGNAITRKIFHLVSGTDIYDTQTGLRCFHSDLINYMLSIAGERYEYEMNMLLGLKKNHIKVKELEIETIYIDNNKASHFDTLKDSFRIYKEILKFSLASFLSFLIDYMLFLIFSLFLNITISNLIARVISATFNYHLNQKLVFGHHDEKSVIKYILLAIGILILNTLLLNGLVYLGIYKIIAKIITEILLFSISYIVQKTFIFMGGD